LVIEGFSTARSLCGSEGGAADEATVVVKLKLSTLGMVMPFCDVTGRDSGEWILEEDFELEVEGVLRVLLSTTLSDAMVL